MRFRTLLSSTILVVATSIPAFTQRTAPPQPVIITNDGATASSPVPVRGSVSATITNSTVPVAVRELPGVTVSSMPAVTLGAGSMVAIDPATVVKTIDSATCNTVRLSGLLGRIFGQTLSNTNAQIFNAGSAIDYHVPSGKCLVVTNISARGAIPSTEKPDSLNVETCAADNTNCFTASLEPHELPYTYLGVSSAYKKYVFNNTSPLYVDSGQSISLSFTTSGVEGLDNMSVSVTLQGYLVNCGAPQ